VDAWALGQKLRYAPLEELMAEADAVRRSVKGDGVFLRAIVEFSNYCVRNCLYCGLRRSNRNIKRYRMHTDLVIDLAWKAAENEVGTVVLQSGDDLDYPAEEIAGMIERIKEGATIKVTLSLGERPFGDYELWRKAGADRYLMKHETSDERLYRRMHPGKTLTERLTALRFLKSLGYETGTGFIVGLPGQRWETLVDDVLLTRDLGVDMCGVGPFVPQADTALSSAPSGLVEMTLRVVALLRLCCAHLNLPATTALATIDPREGQVLGLRAGANVIMPVFTPPEVREHFRIYDNKTPLELSTAWRDIHRAGRFVIRDGGLKAHA
jgi:biotin synthase